MTPRVLCLLTDGFEEIETITPIDLLRRAGIDVVVVSMGKDLHATGRSGITIAADRLFGADILPENFDLLLIPGGPGVAKLREGGLAAKLACEFHAQGKILAAICAAPLVLMDAGLLEGRKFTAHSSTRNELPDSFDDRVFKDGPIITSRGAGTSIDFSLAIITALAGADAASQVATSIMA